MTTIARPTKVRLNTAETAEYAGCHTDTVLRAAESGALHGAQRTKPRGRWSFHILCIEAWLDGATCPHAEDGPQ